MRTGSGKPFCWPDCTGSFSSTHAFNFAHSRQLLREITSLLLYHIMGPPGPHLTPDPEASPVLLAPGHQVAQQCGPHLVCEAEHHHPPSSSPLIFTFITSSSAPPPSPPSPPNILTHHHPHHHPVISPSPPHHHHHHTTTTDLGHRNPRPPAPPHHLRHTSPGHHHCHRSFMPLYCSEGISSFLLKPRSL